MTVAPRRGPRQGVHAEVALRVDERAAGDVADLGDLERPQRVARGVGEEAVEVVELARHVDRGALVPPRAVQLDPLVSHGASIARRRARPRARRRGPPQPHRGVSSGSTAVTLLAAADGAAGTPSRSGEPDQPSGPSRQGPVMAKVTPGVWMLTNIQSPLNVAPANSSND